MRFRKLTNDLFALDWVTATRDTTETDKKLKLASLMFNFNQALTDVTRITRLIKRILSIILVLDMTYLESMS